VDNRACFGRWFESSKGTKNFQSVAHVTSHVTTLMAFGGPTFLSYRLLTKLLIGLSDPTERCVRLTAYQVR
jgi:hypothetical protein